MPSKCKDGCTFNSYNGTCSVCHYGPLGYVPPKPMPTHWLTDDERPAAETLSADELRDVVAQQALSNIGPISDVEMLWAVNDRSPGGLGSGRDYLPARLGHALAKAKLRIMELEAAAGDSGDPPKQVPGSDAPVPPTGDGPSLERFDALLDNLRREREAAGRCQTMAGGLQCPRPHGHDGKCPEPFLDPNPDN